jgi:hypothetical protein
MVEPDDFCATPAPAWWISALDLAPDPTIDFLFLEKKNSVDS